SGSFTVAEGFASLLAGSGLEASPRSGGGYALRRVATPPQPPSAAPSASTGAAGTQTTATTLDTVQVTATRDARDEVFEKLGSSSVVTREQLDRIPVTNARDMFTSEAGVYVMDGNQDPGLNINIRGIQGPGRNNVMIDGTRQNASNYAGYSGQISRVYVDPELIGGISIEKGPTTGAYGSGAIGGVVNMRTLNADDLIARGETSGGRLRIITGDKGYNTSAAIAGSVRLDNGLELTGGFSRRKSDNTHAGSKDLPAGGYGHCSGIFGAPIPGCTDELPLTHQDMTSALAKARYNFGGGHSLELATTYYNNAYASWQVGYELTDVGMNQQEATNQTYTARYAWKPEGNPWIDLRANIWKVDGQTENTSYAERYQLDTWGLEVFNTSRLATPWVDVNLTYGGEYHADRARTETPSGFGLGNGGADPSRIGLTGAGKRQMASVFANASVLRGDWLQVDLGARRDSYSIDARGSYASPFFGQAPYPFTLERGNHRVSPRAAIGITPVTGVQGFASYSEGYRPPSLAEAAGAGTVFGVYNIPNFSLESELAKSREIGVNLVREDIAGGNNKLRGKVAVFRNEYDNFISRTTIPAYNDSSGYTYINLDKVIYQGLELQANFDAGVFFADVNYTRFDKMLFCRDGVCSKDISNIANNSQPYLPPKSSLHATFGARLMERKLVLGLRIRNDNKRGLSEPNIFNSGVQWRPYEIYDLFASYALNPKTTLGLSAENIQDKYYVGALSFNGIPAPGRNLKASLTYAF
ncbi:MAG: TonB-dependent receptor, partial [Haliea sp.]